MAKAESFRFERVLEGFGFVRQAHLLFHSFRSESLRYLRDLPKSRPWLPGSARVASSWSLLPKCPSDVGRPGRGTQPGTRFPLGRPNGITSFLEVEIGAQSRNPLQEGQPFLRRTVSCCEFSAGEQQGDGHPQEPLLLHGFLLSVSPSASTRPRAVWTRLWAACARTEGGRCLQHPQ